MKKNTWVILGLAILLATLYFFTKENQVSVGMKRMELPAFAKEQVTRIQIKGKETVTITKEDGQWQVMLPANKRLVKADASNIDAMLDAAQQMTPSYYVTTLEDRYSDLGLLDDKATMVEISGANKVLWELKLGNSTEGQGRYAMLPNQKDVYVVKASFWPLLRNNVSDWRDRRVLNVSEADLVRFRVLREGKLHLSLNKDMKTKEWMLAPDQTGVSADFRADQTMLSGLVMAVTDLRASGFNDEEKELNNPAITVIIEDKDAKTYTINISKGVEDKYLIKHVDNMQIFEVNKFAVERFNKSLAEIRDLSLFKFDKSSVNKISLKDKKNPVIVEKKDGKWQMINPAQLPAEFEFDEKTADDLLNLVLSLTALRIADKKDLPKNSSWLTEPLLELVDSSAQKTALFATPKNADEYLIKGNIDNEIYVIAQKKLSLLLKGIFAFKKEEFELPHIDENTKGFESLPVDIQRKLLDAAKKSRN